MRISLCGKQTYNDNMWLLIVHSWWRLFFSLFSPLILNDQNTNDINTFARKRERLSERVRVRVCVCASLCVWFRSVESKNCTGQWFRVYFLLQIIGRPNIRNLVKNKHYLVGREIWGNKSSVKVSQINWRKSHIWYINWILINFWFKKKQSR